MASATASDAGSPSDCTSTAEGFTDDVTAFANGYATLTEIRSSPPPVTDPEACDPRRRVPAV